MEKDKNKLIIMHLAKEPAFLLVFSICLMFGAGASYNLWNGNQLEDKLIALATFIVAIFAALFAIRCVTTSKTPNTHTRELEVKSNITNDLKFNELVNNIANNINVAQSNYRHKVFESVMLEDLQEWSLFSDSWGKGEYRAQKDYNQVLLKFYKEAESSIFSTCLPEYVKIWRTEFGKQILKTHLETDVSVTRVFVYDRASDVTQEDFEVLKEHAAQEPKIRSYIYFDEEDNAFSFPTILSKDFTLVDEGKALGVTVSFGIGKLEAQWRFGGADSEKWMPIIIKCKEQLLGVSKPLSEWLLEKNIH
ncbi:hypothetical protein MN202_19090 [Rheinheimera muenzenbergensis]|uniref:DUF3137 domain-containing protein n=1 Tax=Rheinheimera muenzenbergensis TaxID=1193628 RepID=A0ABU8CBI3_9GAMM